MQKTNRFSYPQKQPVVSMIMQVLLSDGIDTAFLQSFQGYRRK